MAITLIYSLTLVRYLHQRFFIRNFRIFEHFFLHISLQNVQITISVRKCTFRYLSDYQPKEKKKKFILYLVDNDE